MLAPQIPAGSSDRSRAAPFTLRGQLPIPRRAQCPSRTCAPTTRTASRRAIGQPAPDTRKDIGVPVREMTLQLRSE